MFESCRAHRTTQAGFAGRSGTPGTARIGRLALASAGTQSEEVARALPAEQEVEDERVG
jgi:hypothetical protein